MKTAVNYKLASGKLKVTVMKGCNLVVRDLRSSDPYVLLCLGSQVKKTSTKWRDLNPTWNETFIFDPPPLVDSYCAPLKVEVWDRDKLSKDDFMGCATVDVTRMVYGLNSGKSIEPIKIFGDGRTTQDVCVKLSPSPNPKKNRFGFFKCKSLPSDLGSLYLKIEFFPYYGSHHQ